jgi:hypothetical protein
MEVEVEMNVEAEPDTQHALVSEADLNDADAIFNPKEYLDGKILELMNRLVELLKRKDVVREATVQGDAKMKEAEDGNDDWKLKELEIVFPSFEEDEVPQGMVYQGFSGRANPTSLKTAQKFQNVSMRLPSPRSLNHPCKFTGVGSKVARPTTTTTTTKRQDTSDLLV